MSRRLPWRMDFCRPLKWSLPKSPGLSILKWSSMTTGWWKWLCTTHDLERIPPYRYGDLWRLRRSIGVSSNQTIDLREMLDQHPRGSEGFNEHFTLTYFRAEDVFLSPWHHIYICIYIYICIICNYIFEIIYLGKLALSRGAGGTSTDKWLRYTYIYIYIYIGYACVCEAAGLHSPMQNLHFYVFFPRHTCADCRIAAGTVVLIWSCLKWPQSWVWLKFIDRNHFWFCLNETFLADSLVRV